jgi:hypothetical protein
MNLSASEDPFIVEGLSSSSDPDIVIATNPSQTSTRANRIQIGKAHCEKLNEKLFCSKARYCTSQRTHAEQCGVYLSNLSSDSDMLVE